MNKRIYKEKLHDKSTFELILVEGGSFMMGDEGEASFDGEQPVHQVIVPDFYIGKYPVTQILWEQVMGDNPSRFKGAERPVERVSWHDTQVFLGKLREISGRKYRLLTEAEWEYAARGGVKSRGHTYAGSAKLKDVGWYNENAYGETKPVGLKYPNELGIYDMSGNVLEWVEDQWHDNYKGAPKDGSTWLGREDGSNRVVRGGSWFNTAWWCRVSFRDGNAPSNRSDDVGFRLGLSLQSVG